MFLTILKNVLMLLKEYFMGNYPLANYLREHKIVKFFFIFYFVLYIGCLYVIDQGLAAAQIAREEKVIIDANTKTINDLIERNTFLIKSVADYEQVKLEICGQFPYYGTPRELDNTQVCRIMHGKKLIP